MRPKLLCTALAVVLFLLWGLPAEAQNARAVKNRSGKRGPALASLHKEHAAHGRRARGRKFRSTNRLLNVQGDHVVVDAVAAGHPDTLRAELEAIGMREIAQTGNVVSGLLPIAALDDLDVLPSLQFARPTYATTRGGLTTSQGDAAMHADDARAAFGVDGTGITVGTLSDTFDCAGDAGLDVANGDLPPGIEVLDDSVCPSGIDEGRAMMQLIHDVAPGAGQSFHTAFGGQADFALGIEELAGCPAGSEPGCIPAATPADVIVDDIIYYAEPMFQDGIIAQAVDVVTAAGVSYFSSAGNNARDSYEAPFDLVGGLHDFDPSGAVDTCQTLSIPTGTTVFSLQWSQPFFSVSGAPGAASDLDIALYHDAGCSVYTGFGGFADNLGGDPVEVVGFVNNGPTKTLGLRLSLYAGPVPDLVKYVAFSGSSFSIDEHDTASSTLYGHTNAAGAEAVSAAYYLETPEFGTAPPQLEWYSSAGPTPILFDTLGLPTSELRDKPEIVAPDGTNTTFFGFDSEPDGFPNFFGTSASAPHAAAVAALMLESAGPLSPAAVYAALEGTAIDMDDPATAGFDVGFDFGTGYGLIDAASAIGTVSGPPKVLTSIAVTPDGGVTLTPGESQQLTAIGTYDDLSTQDLTAVATWVSAFPAVADVAAGGLATGVGAGNTTVTASHAGVTSNAAPLDVVAPVDVVTVIEAIYKPDRKEFKVRATSSEQPDAVLTVEGFGPMTFKKNKYELRIRPLAPELVPQTITVQSSLGGSAVAAVVGAPAPPEPPGDLVSIAISPAGGSIGIGQTGQFTATGTYENGSTADITASATWNSTDGSVATIDATGLATGVSEGTTSITATEDAVTSPAASLEVTDAPAAGDEVTITKAEWKAKNSELKVEALSSEQPDAVLTVEGFGQMQFRRGKYELRLRGVPNPRVVTVTSSLGGSATMAVPER